MKEELIRVLNGKLNDINADIDSLVELNNKIESENNNLSYVSDILELFNDNGSNDILNFVKLNKEDFEKVLSIIGDEAREVFNTDGCNYDGLTYLINGINSGISLVLNEEQKNGINYLIGKLNEKVNDYSAAIDGYQLVKTRYAISDVDELRDKRDNYDHVISNLNNDEYVSNTNLLMEAIKYEDLSDADTIDLLTYVLKYNADIYEKNGGEEVKEEYNIDYQEENSEPVEYDNDYPINNENVEDYEESVEESREDEYSSSDDIFHFNAIPESNIDEQEPITFENENNEDYEESTEEEFQDSDEVDYIPATEYQEESPAEEYNSTDEETSEAKEEYDNDYQLSNDNVDDVPVENEEVETPQEEVSDENEETVEQEEFKENNDVAEGFENIIDEHEDYEEESNIEEREKTSTCDVQGLLEKYGIKADNSYINELVIGERDYKDILETLKDKNLIDKLSHNMDLFTEILLYSNSDTINKVLEIIEDDLSVDKEDFEITTNITIDTIPSVFVLEGGNFDNFVENTKVFKEIGLNLINLFDFSKEIFIADNSKILNNLDIVKKYGYEINYKNAKYLLLLPNLADKLDYFVESVYEDKLKNETFDGLEYVKDYTAKLNVVTDETIKRIRYASENGRKVFGTKPGSLSGEITNLKVNALDISSDYLNKFFDNDFANLTGDEVREYERLVHNSSNVGNYADELEILSPYLQGLRYVIDDINISYNKVVRNYNILRSYGIDIKKALEFAVCYNLVITKEEYDKLKDKLEELGGNQ